MLSAPPAHPLGPLWAALEAQHLVGAKAWWPLLDPDKPWPSPVWDALPTGPEAGPVLVGGSLLHQGNTQQALQQVRQRLGRPAVLFPGHPMQLHEAADAVLFLALVSGRNPELLIGHHVHAAPWLRAWGGEVWPTAYLLVGQGTPTTATYLSQTTPLPPTKPALAAATALAAHYLGQRLVYLDAGSGADAAIPPAVVGAVRQAVPGPLVVGGGLRTAQSVAQAWQAGADVAIVGTALEDPAGARLVAQLQQARAPLAGG